MAIVSVKTLQFALVNLSLFGVYALWFLFLNNGSSDMLNTSKEAGYLPDTTLPLKVVYTGIPPIDSIFVILNAFFWPAGDGNNPTLSLLCFQFLGQFLAAWPLLVLDSLRAGNVGKANT